VDANPPPVDSGNPSSCSGYAAPSEPASCYCDSTLHACAVNGCYNGYYCHTAVTPNKCVAKPSGC
jgi:hypothetical protein